VGSTRRQMPINFPGRKSRSSSFPGPGPGEVGQHLKARANKKPFIRGGRPRKHETARLLFQKWHRGQDARSLLIWKRPKEEQSGNGRPAALCSKSRSLFSKDLTLPISVDWESSEGRVAVADSNVACGWWLGSAAPTGMATMVAGSVWSHRGSNVVGVRRIRVLADHLDFGLEGVARWHPRSVCSTWRRGTPKWITLVGTSFCPRVRKNRQRRRNTAPRPSNSLCASGQSKAIFAFRWTREKEHCISALEAIALSASTASRLRALRQSKCSNTGTGDGHRKTWRKQGQPLQLVLCALAER